jgi:ABC-type transporter Mla maintaining outer membrane lipid asymmetry ATPase subunit MlaF
MKATSELLLKANRVVGRTVYGKEVGESSPINFTLHSGEIGGFLYSRDAIPLFQLIMGMGDLTSGELSLYGQPLVKALEGSSTAWRQLVGFADCRKGLLSNLSLLDNVNLPAKYHGYYLQNDDQESVAATELTRLQVPPELWSKRPNDVMGHMRKRAILARSVVLNPKVLILDSPSELFSWHQLPLLGEWIVSQQKLGRGILIGSDNVPFLLALCNWLILAPNGEMERDFKQRVDPTWLEGADIMHRVLDCKVSGGSR